MASRSPDLAAETEAFPPPPGAEGTRERLLSTALRLFAEEGMLGASLRRIVSGAGAANPSALHYHFGSREALVDALAGLLFARLRRAALPRLESLPARHGVRDVLEAVFGPMVELSAEGDGGRHAVQFLARLSWEFGPQGQALSSQGLADIAEAAIGRLQALLPRKSGDHIRLQFLMAMTNVFHGLADYNYVKLAPFGPRRALSRELRMTLFFDYLEAGLRG